MRSASAICLVMLLFGSNARSQSLTFEAWLVKDTVLVYEDCWVRFRAVNGTSTPVQYRPLAIDGAFITIELTDAGGNPIRMGGPVSTYVPLRPSELEPGDTARGIGTIQDKANRFYNKAAHLHYLPTGEYRAVFKWAYDPYLRVLFNESIYLIDTVTFVVCDPAPQTATALEGYLNLFAMRLERKERNEHFWDFSNEHLGTPYGEQALWHLTNLVRLGSPVPYDLPTRTIIARFALHYPNNPDVVFMISHYEKALGESVYREFLQEVVDSVPGTSAASCANSVLKQGER